MKVHNASNPLPGQNGRQRLIHAGLTLFAEQGYHGTSVRKLGDAAGVSFGLIRKLFGSKAGLREAVDAYVIDEIQSFTDAILEQLDAAEDTDGLARCVEFAQTHREVMRYLQFAFFHAQPGTQDLFNRYFQIHQQVFETLAARGQLADYVDRRWAPFLSVFLQMGPFIVEPFATEVLGQAISSPAAVRECQQAFGKMIRSWANERAETPS